MSNFIKGWSDTYGSNFPIAAYSSERKKALVEKIRQRKYNFNFQDAQFLPNCCPYYDDGKICVLTKKEFDETMKEAWSDRPLGARLLPMDVLTAQGKNGLLYEKAKYMEEDENNV